MINFEGEEADYCLGNEADVGLLSCRTSFIITEDMEVELNSMSLVMNVLNGLGYTGFDKLREMVLDVGFEKMLDLLGFIFTSEAPLTDTFIKKCYTSKKCELLSPLVQQIRVAEEERLFTLKVFVRKLDGVVLYAECREEFIDSLFSFLAIPLEFAWELSSDNANMGFVGNFCGSMKGLSFEKQKEATISKCVLPYYYNFHIQPLDVDIQEMPQYECLIDTYHVVNSKLAINIEKTVRKFGEYIVKLSPVSASVGFMK